MFRPGAKMGLPAAAVKRNGARWGRIPARTPLANKELLVGAGKHPAPNTVPALCTHRPSLLPIGLGPEALIGGNGWAVGGLNSFGVGDSSCKPAGRPAIIPLLERPAWDVGVGG